MKHIDIDDVITKRKKLSRPSLPPPPPQPEQSDLLDRLKEMAKTNAPLHQDTKVEILHLIADKTGVILNKSIVTPYLSLVYCHQMKDLSPLLKKGESFFVLGGEVREYCLSQQSQGLKFNTQPPLSYSQQSQIQDDSFFTLQQFQLANPTFTFQREIDPMAAVGKIFRQKPQKYATFKVVACQRAFLVLFRQIEREDEFIYGWGLNQEEKLELVKYFPVLKLLGKKLSNFINNFNLKQFHFKQQIYKKGEIPTSVYFVIEGEVSFELVLDDLPEPTKIASSTITPNSYFGQQQLLFKSTTRSHTAKVITSKCTVLQLSRDKFQKLMENSQFSQLVIKTSKMKELERNKNILKARKILCREREPEEDQGQLTEEEVKHNSVNYRGESRRRFSTFRAGNQKVKIMHGNVIRDFPEVKGRVQFSMLHVNPDHYAATKDKYRQYFIKQTEERGQKPWDFRKLWKVLNLEDVLSENEIQIKNTDGRKFFDTHRRLQHQINQSKSVRPKTTSSNYRTKMQYIAYLQQFNQ